MDITQLFSDLAILAGILLMTVLAVGPLWLAHSGTTARPQRSELRTRHIRTDEASASPSRG